MQADGGVLEEVIQLLFALAEGLFRLQALSDVFFEHLVPCVDGSRSNDVSGKRKPE